MLCQNRHSSIRKGTFDVKFLSMYIISLYTNNICFSVIEQVKTQQLTTLSLDNLNRIFMETEAQVFKYLYE